ncbi:MAG: DUF4157 domain-containing protein [Nannocystis sp.]|nr:DUF4157 domain-containing protein [Nannocystis sp.]
MDRATSTRESVVAHTTEPERAASGERPRRPAATRRNAAAEAMQATFGNRIVQRQLQAGIDAAAGRGRPLDGGVRAHLQPRLNFELGATRVHTDGAADRMAQSLGALAFTTGSDIFFRAGAYDRLQSPGRYRRAAGRRRRRGGAGGAAGARGGEPARGPDQLLCRYFRRTLGHDAIRGLRPAAGHRGRWADGRRQHHARVLAEQERAAHRQDRPDPDGSEPEERGGVAGARAEHERGDHGAHRDDPGQGRAGDRPRRRPGARSMALAARRPSASSRTA